MKRIIIDARESGSSTGRYVDKLIEYLHKLNPPYEIVVLAKAKRMEYLRTVAPSFAIIETPYDEFGFGEQLGLLKQIRALKPDLVHFAIVQQPILYPGKTVTTMHDLITLHFKNPSKNPIIFTIKQAVYWLVNQVVARKSTFVITPTKFVKRDIMRFARLPARKFIVTYESADKIPDDPEPVEQLQGKQFLMYVGRPQPHKNLERLIEAFEGLQWQNPDLYLVLVGKKDKTYQLLEAKVKQRDIPNVIFTDFVSEGQLRWLYEHCAAYTFPSLSEGFGLPGLEAMIHGAPVVSSNTSCLPEVYGKAAHYFNPTNTQSMVDAITDVLQDKELRQQLVTSGYRRIAQFSWQHMAAQTLHVYERALEKKK